MGLDEVGETIEKLRPFADKVAAVNFDKKRFFTLCVRASFTKSFQFIDYAYTQTGPDFNSAFFLVPALRSITWPALRISDQSILERMASNERGSYEEKQIQ